MNSLRRFVEKLAGTHGLAHIAAALLRDHARHVLFPGKRQLAARFQDTERALDRGNSLLRADVFELKHR